MTKRKVKSFLPIVLIFVILNGFFIAGKSMLARWGVDQEVVIIGNLLLFVISIVSFLLGLRGLKNPNPHAFVRSVYTSMMLKLFICIIAAFIYISMYRDNLNKPALFICMGLYLLYTFVEVSILTKLLKGKTNE
ncbi:MAG TPA: hypothetical protein VFS22_08195 [Flavisolibacter sp.]|nr:hypothetical protein [Flavisolibacter sp.]